MLDWNLLSESTNGKPEVAQKVLNSYLVMLDRTQSRMEAALEIVDREALGFAAHSLRSASKSVGAVRLATMLGQIEDEGGDMEAGLLVGLVRSTLSHMGEVRAEVEREVEEECISNEGLGRR